MVTFVRHALAYVTGQNPESLFKDTSHYERGRQLLAELQQRPFLLVLDGFERVLTAYHRLDKAQLPDEQAEEGDLRDCVNPQDGDLLTQLLRCQPSKILISTRLFPKILEDRASHCSIVGVPHHKLNGLLPDDAIALMRHAKITGDERAMLEFANQFGRHSLLLRIVCGMIADYRKKPYDFDAWRADPVYGGSLKLTDLDLKQRYTHILHFALRGLDEQTRRLLCRIAVISENAEYTTLAVLNPFLPNEPTDAERTQAVTAFDEALQELEERGLLQWDREINRYDMHPVVRAYAAELLEDGERKETFLKVRDHFEALPPDDLDTATELAHVAHSLEIYRCLIGAGLLEEAADYYRGNLCDILLFHLGAYAVVLELLKPLFRGDFNGLPALESAQKRSYFLNELARCHSELGRKAEALTVYAKTFLIDLEYMAWHNLRIGLSNYGSAWSKLNRRAEIAQVYQLARDLADSAEDVDGVSRSILDQMTVAIYKGRFTDVTSLDDEFRQRPQPPLRIYRPGDAEYWRCVSQFCQSQLTDAAWQAGYDLCVRHRNVFRQYQFLALRAEWDLTANRSERALDAIDQALQITKKLGTPTPEYHGLRAWALARLGRPTEAHAALQDGEQRLYAAEAYRVLGDTAQARTCALNAYRGAWGEGPPYIHWYYLERSRALLRELGEPEPQLPPFDPSKVPPIPYEKEIRAAIAKLRAEKAQREQDTE